MRFSNCALDFHACPEKPVLLNNFAGTGRHRLQHDVRASSLN
jgi:hypothetical protein